jgi:hypothetical protein
MADCEINPPPFSKAQFVNHPIMGSLMGSIPGERFVLQYDHVPFDLAWPQTGGRYTISSR